MLHQKNSFKSKKIDIIDLCKMQLNIIHEIIKPEYSLSNTYPDFIILTGYIFFLWVMVSVTLRESD